MSQFANPRGILGRVAGVIMATRSSNRERNAWTLSLLKIAAADRVLEIGFGPGWAIGEAAKTASRVVGVDRSALMVKEAAKRNRAVIDQGKVKLILGSVENGALEDLSATETRFDKIFSSNVVQFWKHPADVLGRLLHLLAPDGTVAITYQPRHRGATDADSESFAAGIAGSMRAAGFTYVSIERKSMKPLRTVCVLGSRSLDDVKGE